MSKRTLPTSINMNEYLHASTGGQGVVTVQGHSGHTITVYPDKAVFCETESVFINFNDVLTKNRI